MSIHELFIERCFQLADRAALQNEPNPKVGSILVYKGKIIGEGYHKKFGQAHAEVECINSVCDQDKPLISQSTMYVSLEPCCHFGKTPPCTDLILHHRIPEVVISTPDPNPLVSGKGIAQLKTHGVDVKVGILQKKGLQLIHRFITNHQKNRPYITIKMAISADGYLGVEGKKVWLSNAYSSKWSHKLRSENQAILVGSETVLCDDPELTCRLYPGKNPIRLILDRRNRIPEEAKVFNDQAPTLHFSSINRNFHSTLNQSIHTPDEKDNLPFVLNTCISEGIFSIIVEGGPKIIQSFLHSNLWDQLCMVKTPVVLGNGLLAPVVEGQLEKIVHLGSDVIYTLLPKA
ncbi:MAG TPA: bifunctional diaminohydroxyphosphoribosylaminopyrimidine deaminase/5-amino-6-(5-phosphoribosylamino)uracil reductase RibD [Saprospiraceae bacterium]|nr:bifunctional diaminohydroxyphosphoribosylaminopyrimidine deaminase/5-amino-6-(5-phosphoribosylamino)uracil reductase RibD [Saprospiraceae bacterium]